MKTISPEQAQSIIKVACNAWKQKLADKWGKNIVLHEAVEILDEFYSEMRSSCNSDQHKVFDIIFGKDVQYKVGDWIVILYDTNRHGRAIGGVYQINGDGPNGTFHIGKKDGNGNIKVGDMRLATPEEINKATYLPKGTACFVRDNIHFTWELVYADGNGKFYCGGSKSGVTDSWTYVHKYSDGLPEE